MKQNKKQNTRHTKQKKGKQNMFRTYTKKNITSTNKTNIDSHTKHAQ